MSKNKNNQKGGQIGGIIIDKIFNVSSIKIYLVNIFFVIINCIIFYKLFSSNEYDITLYLFIILCIVSFFTVIFIVWQILKYKNFIYSYFTSNLQDVTKDPTSFARIVVLGVLMCSGLLQCSSAILFTIVLNNRPPPNNSFKLTETNARHLYNYEISYIITYICMIFVAIILVTPVSNNSREKIAYYMTLLIGILGIGYNSISAFASCFAIYSNRNQLYLGSPDIIIDTPIINLPEISTVPTPNLITTPNTKLPLCTKPVPTNKEPEDNDDSCY